MNARRDEDALSWDGDDDPTLDVGGARGVPADARAGDDVAPGGDDDRHDDAARSAASGPAPEQVSLPDGFTAVGRGSERVEHVGEDAGVAPMGNAALVGIGVLGGVYLLFVIGWIVGGLRLQGKAQYLVADVMFQGSFWLAALAPLVWFVTVFLLTARSRAWVRFLWLLAGVVLLVPWPFVMIGVVGQ